jgi:hypothetical protein
VVSVRSPQTALGLFVVTATMGEIIAVSDRVREILKSPTALKGPLGAGFLTQGMEKSGRRQQAGIQRVLFWGALEAERDPLPSLSSWLSCYPYRPVVDVFRIY